MTGNPLQQPVADHDSLGEIAPSAGRWQPHPFSRFAFAPLPGDDGSTAQLFVDGDAYCCSVEFARRLCDAERSVSGESVSTAVDRELLTRLIKTGKLQADEQPEPSR